jgi:K+-sensing histidine kinase KdpD
VVLVALTWGSGPSLVATLVGVVLLDFIVFPPPFTWSYATARDVVSVGLVLGVGLLISLVAGQVARARLQAEQARTASETQAGELETILESITEGVAVVDRAGRALRHQSRGPGAAAPLHAVRRPGTPARGTGGGGASV